MHPWPCSRAISPVHTQCKLVASLTGQCMLVAVTLDTQFCPKKLFALGLSMLIFMPKMKQFGILSLSLALQWMHKHCLDRCSPAVLLEALHGCRWSVMGQEAREGRLGTAAIVVARQLWMSHGRPPRVP